MRTINPENSLLLMIDIQEKLMPAIENASEVIGNANRLIDAAQNLNIPVVFTEQNPDGLGATVATLANKKAGDVFGKIAFDACRETNFIEALNGKTEIVVAGCEAHVCVLQTVLGLLETACKVYVAGDAIGSRLTANKEASLNRMQGHGAEIVTTEMAIFEWLGRSDHPKFRDILKSVK